MVTSHRINGRGYFLKKLGYFYLVAFVEGPSHTLPPGVEDELCLDQVLHLDLGSVVDDVLVVEQRRVGAGGPAGVNWPQRRNRKRQSASNKITRPRTTV